MSFKFDLLFEIEVPRPWDERKERNRFHEAIEQAVFAEEMGFDTIWLVEHHFTSELAHSSAPEVLLGALAMRTSRIRLGFGVALLPGEVNHPIRVAERAATLDILSDGRVEMGSGRSSSPWQIAPFGVDVNTTREQWEESLKLLPELWTREGFSYHGNFWSWDAEVTVLPKPLQKPHPPLWVASTQPDTCALAGRHGIGLLVPAMAPPETLQAQVDAYKEAIVEPTDQIGHFKNDQCALFTVGFCHDDDDTARRLGGLAGVWYIQTVTKIYSGDWAGEPLEAVPDSYRWHAENRRKGRAGVGSHLDLDADDPMLSANEFIDMGAFCVGDPEHVKKTVERYRQAGADRIVSVMQLAELEHDDLMRSIELFGREVIPHVRELEAREAAAASTSVSGD